MRSLLMGCRTSFFNLETKVLGKTHKRASRPAFRPGQVPVVLGLTGPGDGISFHPPGPGSDALPLKAGGWMA